MSPVSVTVFIPTRNRSHLLPHAVRSVLAQTFEDFRLVISDNASTDRTREVVAEFDDPRLSYVRHARDIGLTGNYNWCLERADTEYLFILPDDDLIAPDFLSETVAVLEEHPRAGMVHTAFDVIGPGDELLLGSWNWTCGLSEDTIEGPDQFTRESMRWACRVCSSTALIRTRALPVGGMLPDDFPAVDFGWWLRMAAAGWDFAYLAKNLGAYRIHGASHSATFGPPHGAGYVHGLALVLKLKEIKERIAAARPPAERRQLLRLAKKHLRGELIDLVRNVTLPQRRPGPTFRSLARAARTEPGVLLEGRAWRVAGASLLGPRLVNRMRRSRLS
jgi:glycosyltransferase involved in cell wall biosynthesis